MRNVLRREKWVLEREVVGVGKGKRELKNLVCNINLSRWEEVRVRGLGSRYKL